MKEDRRIYLSNTEIDDALNLYLERLESCGESLKVEEVDIREAAGRVTSLPVFAKVSSPNHNAAAMDGIAVVSENTIGASETTPIILERKKDYEYINTGYVIKDPYDAVIMIEDIVVIDEDHIQIIASASPWQHIRPIGEDIISGEMIIPANHKIRPMDIGAILSGGQTTVSVYEKIQVGIIPTGTEIVDTYDELSKGNIFDTNSWVFKSLVEEYGGIANRISPVEDEYGKLKEVTRKIVNDNHIIVINAGSSAGSKDYTVKIIEELGEVVLHGIAIKPGKPTILGIIDGKPVIGIPGYPGSAYLVFEEFVQPVIRKLQKIKQEKPMIVTATVSRRIVSSLKYREYVRIKLGQVGDKLIATPLNRGAGVTMALVRADGLIVIPKNSEGLEAGEAASVELMKDIEDIQNTIVSIGSHDLIMDIIGNLITEKYEDMHLSSAHVGSMGGVMALRRGEAHLAPIHLLDEESGEYNISYLKKYLSHEKMVLIKGVRREQGMIVNPGNPKGVASVLDLCRKDVVFVNRQKGSGTRLLTDYLLKKANIKVSDIKGYEREMTTHMAVAACVEGHSSDAGIGVYSAAKALSLDFIPLGYEDYDFAVPEKYLDSELIQCFIETLKSDLFKQTLNQLGGYEVARAGEIIYIR